MYSYLRSQIRVREDHKIPKIGWTINHHHMWAQSPGRACMRNISNSFLGEGSFQRRQPHRLGTHLTCTSLHFPARSSVDFGRTTSLRRIFVVPLYHRSTCRIWCRISYAPTTRCPCLGMAFSARPQHHRSPKRLQSVQPKIMRLVWSKQMKTIIYGRKHRGRYLHVRQKLTRHDNDISTMRALDWKLTLKIIAVFWWQCPFYNGLQFADEFGINLIN